MNTSQLKQYIAQQYNSDEEYPWIKFPEYCVFRHRNNQKWFALIMDVPKSKIGLEGNEKIDILDVKCDPILIGSLLNEKGFFPAYHMSKSSWITIALDGSVDDEKIFWLIDSSYSLTS
ncbi:MAG: MmcQ/YjbR family DNA-binding protein [Eubacterium sp.]|nr:MmcQ/YjbR family DNA-binding protein [Eubacterium sp.]